MSHLTTARKLIEATRKTAKAAPKKASSKKAPAKKTTRKPMAKKSEPKAPPVNRRFDGAKREESALRKFKLSLDDAALRMEGPLKDAEGSPPTLKSLEDPSWTDFRWEVSRIMVETSEAIGELVYAISVAEDLHKDATVVKPLAAFHDATSDITRPSMPLNVDIVKNAKVAYESLKNAKSNVPKLFDSAGSYGKFRTALDDIAKAIGVLYGKTPSVPNIKHAPEREAPRQMRLFQSLTGATRSLRSYLGEETSLTRDEVLALGLIMGYKPQGRYRAFNNAKLGDYGESNPVIKSLLSKSMLKKQGKALVLAKPGSRKVYAQELHKFKSDPMVYGNLPSFYKDISWIENQSGWEKNRELSLLHKKLMSGAELSKQEQNYLWDLQFGKASARGFGESDVAKSAREILFGFTPNMQ